jgi:hypothetical protein
VTIADEAVEMVETLTSHALQIKESTAIFSQASLLYQAFQRDMKTRMRWDGLKFARYYLLDQPVKREAEAA